MLREVPITVQEAGCGPAIPREWKVTRYYSDNQTEFDYFYCPVCKSRVDIKYEYFPKENEIGSPIIKYPLECSGCKIKYSILLR